MNTPKQTMRLGDFASSNMKALGHLIAELETSLAKAKEIFNENMDKELTL